MVKKLASTKGRRLLFFCFFVLCVSYVPSIFADTTSLKATVAAYDKPGVSVGVAVHSIDDGSELFSYNGTKPLMTASIMKVITSAAALTELGGSHEFQTVFSTDSKSRGVAQNLYVKGVGDPSLVEERVWRIAKDIRARGVKKITGDVVIDNSLFDNFDFPGQNDESSRAYNALISPLAVNFNSFAVSAVNDGGVVDVAIDPPVAYFNLVKAAVLGKGNDLSVSRVFKEGIELVSVTGGVSDEKTKYANVTDPVLYAGEVIRWALTQNGVEFTGKIISGPAVGRKILVKDDSKPLSVILRDLNKFSNNFTAEMIVKSMGAKKYGAPGTTDKGMQVLKEFVRGLGVDDAETQIVNGSGLSRRNVVAARVFNKVLAAAYQNNRLRSDLMASFAIAGVDGTLEHRLKSPELFGNVKAKTGTLYDVSSLSGYLETASKKMVAFTMIVNGEGAPAAKYQEMQEKILLDVYKSF